MSKVHLDIPDELRDDLAAYARSHGITIAATIRILLRDALDQKARQLTP
jgi:hypothetical protein